MMKHTARNGFFGMMMLMLVATTAQAQTTEEPKGCSNETLKGAYGVIITGIRPAPFVPVGMPGFVGQLEQVQGAVIQVFDGKGNFTQVESQKGSTSGAVLERSGRGVYTVNADCSVTVTVFPAPGIQIVSKGVLVEGGKELRAVTVSPETVSVQSNARRIN